MTVLVRALLILLSLALGAPALAQTAVTLMDGLNGYTGTTDIELANYAQTTNFGSRKFYELGPATTNSLAIRFAIFAAEGGPVPDNATITSATLSLYRYWGADAVLKAARLPAAQ